MCELEHPRKGWLSTCVDHHRSATIMMRTLLSLLVVALLSASALCAEVLYSFVTLNYTWDAQHTYQDFVSSQRFIPENNLLAGINYDIDGTIYLTVPRWKNGVPATLNKLDTTTQTLTPFPSWDTQIEGDANGVQNVQSMTIDSNRRMWVVDVGRRNFFSKDSSLKTSAPATVWIINMNDSSINDKFVFPQDIVSNDDSFLNDIVVDEARNFAYFSDAWGDGAIIVLDMNVKQARRYSGKSTHRDPFYAMDVNGKNYGRFIFTTPTDGIAMTEDKDAIFYCQVQGTTLYRLPTATLRDFSLQHKDIDKAVQTIGTKEPSDGMKYLNDTLYWGALTISAYFSVPITATSTPDLSKEAVQSEASPETMEWIDTFAIDLKTLKSLYFVSNRLDKFMVGSMDFTGKDGANMRILKVNI